MLFLTVLYIFGSLRYVTVDVDKVKDITKTTTSDFKKGFNEIQGKDI